MLRALALLPLLLLSGACDDTQVAEHGLVQYRLETLTVPDSVHAGEQLDIRVGMYLDCTNEVKRIETSSGPGGISIAVFGTDFSGPGPRPLCPAFFRESPVSIFPQSRGLLRIMALEPHGEPLRDSVVVY